MQDSTDNFEREELANCVTHGVGVLLAMVGAVVLFRAVADTDNAALQASCWVYALGLIAVYAGSALSHSFKDESRRHFFRRLDQGIIFLFIAGNFTPLAITALQEPTRWIVLGVTWAIALVGFSTKVSVEITWMGLRYCLAGNFSMALQTSCRTAVESLPPE